MVSDETLPPSTPAPVADQPPVPPFAPLAGTAPRNLPPPAGLDAPGDAPVETVTWTGRSSGATSRQALAAAAAVAALVTLAGGVVRWRRHHGGHP